MSLHHQKHHRSSAAATANAVGGKTARACDSCLRRRARWYCAADDAFLCQSCDSSVHSANPLARRHDRVLLKTASAKAPPPPKEDSVEPYGAPTWHQGFKRKARTPRRHAKLSFSKRAPLVPDLELAEEQEEEEQEQLIYRVPIFDPILSEFCSHTPPAVDGVDANPLVEDTKPDMVNQWLPADSCDGHGFAGFNPSEMDLAEFAADVESLLGQGLKDDSCIEEALGLMDVREEDMSQVKVEVDVVNNAVGGSMEGSNFVGMEMEFSRESLDINFDCGSPAAGEEDVEEEEQKVDVAAKGNGVKIGLKLDYEAVITAWSCCSCSPWTGGVRPQFNPDDCWPDFMGILWGGGADVQGSYEDIGFGGHTVAADGGREARVSRYREKRRTRLFSKKIRYEVRKLNAEKRPRMKGRFVKRSSFPAAGAPSGYAYA